MPRLYLDADGVLCDFDLYAGSVLGIPPPEFERLHGEHMMWRMLHGVPDLYRALPPMKEGLALYEATSRWTPTILTGIPRSYPDAEEQKLGWRDEWLPGVRMICCPSRNKKDYAQPGDVLVDDRLKYAHLWTAAGGVFVHWQCRDVGKAVSLIDRLMAADPRKRPVGLRFTV
jgi:hypothetical protein